jgi:transcriptional regulator with XRE-family HTH domain
MINYSQAVALQKFRAQSQLTQTELATKLQTTRSQISMAEKGLRPLSAISGRVLEDLIDSLTTAQIRSSFDEQIQFSDEGIQSFHENMNIQLDMAIFKKLKYEMELERLKNAYPQALAMYTFLKTQDINQFKDDIEKDIHLINLNKWEKKYNNANAYSQIGLQLKIDLLSAEAAVITEYLKTY